MRTDTEIMQLIDEAIKSVWKNEIKSDYDANWIMNEDGLKNALYFHLRKQLEPILLHKRGNRRLDAEIEIIACVGFAFHFPCDLKGCDFVFKALHAPVECARLFIRKYLFKRRYENGF